VSRRARLGQGRLAIAVVHGLLHPPSRSLPPFSPSWTRRILSGLRHRRTEGGKAGSRCSFNGGDRLHVVLGVGLTRCPALGAADLGDSCNRQPPADRPWQRALAYSDPHGHGSSSPT
jgi:hypothetical protein